MISELESVVQKSNHIDNINSGGCAINAVAIYDYVLKNHPEYEPKIYYYGYRDGNNKRGIENQDVSGIRCIHALVVITVHDEQMWIESTGIHYEPRNDGRCILNQPPSECFNEINRDLCIEHINTTDWNPSFDRFMDAPRIDEIFGTSVIDEINGVPA